MTTSKVKLYKLSSQEASTKYEGSIESVEGETLSKLRVRLEEAEIMEVSFDFWDNETKYHIKSRLEN